jgi:hypothetical protein
MLNIYTSSVVKCFETINRGMRLVDLMKRSPMRKPNLKHYCLGYYFSLPY